MSTRKRKACDVANYPEEQHQQEEEQNIYPILIPLHCTDDPIIKTKRKEKGIRSGKHYSPFISLMDKNRDVDYNSGSNTSTNRKKRKYSIVFGRKEILQSYHTACGCMSGKKEESYVDAMCEKCRAVDNWAKYALSRRMIKLDLNMGQSKKQFDEKETAVSCIFSAKGSNAKKLVYVVHHDESSSFYTQNTSSTDKDGWINYGSLYDKSVIGFKVNSSEKKKSKSFSDIRPDFLEFQLIVPSKKNQGKRQNDQISTPQFSYILKKSSPTSTKENDSKKEKHNNKLPIKCSMQESTEEEQRNEQKNQSKERSITSSSRSLSQTHPVTSGEEPLSEKNHHQAPQCFNYYSPNKLNPLEKQIAQSQTKLQQCNTVAEKFFSSTLLENSLSEAMEISKPEHQEQVKSQIKPNFHDNTNNESTTVIRLPQANESTRKSPPSIYEDSKLEKEQDHRQSSEVEEKKVENDTDISNVSQPDKNIIFKSSSLQPQIQQKTPDECHNNSRTEENQPSVVKSAKEEKFDEKVEGNDEKEVVNNHAHVEEDDDEREEETEETCLNTPLSLLTTSMTTCISTTSVSLPRSKDTLESFSFNDTTVGRCKKAQIQIVTTTPLKKSNTTTDNYLDKQDKHLSSVAFGNVSPFSLGRRVDCSKEFFNFNRNNCTKKRKLSLTTGDKDGGGKEKPQHSPTSILMESKYCSEREKTMKKKYDNTVLAKEKQFTKILFVRSGRYMSSSRVTTFSNAFEQKFNNAKKEGNHTQVQILTSFPHPSSSMSMASSYRELNVPTHIVIDESMTVEKLYSYLGFQSKEIMVRVFEELKIKVIKPDWAQKILKNLQKPFGCSIEDVWPGSKTFSMSTNTDKSHGKIELQASSNPPQPKKKKNNNYPNRGNEMNQHKWYNKGIARKGGRVSFAPVISVSSSSIQDPNHIIHRIRRLNCSNNSNSDNNKRDNSKGRRNFSRLYNLSNSSLGNDDTLCGKYSPS